MNEVGEESKDTTLRAASAVPQAVELKNGVVAEKIEEEQLQPRFFGTDDMPEEMRRVAVEVARVALKKKTNKDRAEHIKKHFDKTYSINGSGGKWHCIVGTDFGSYVTHEAQSFVFFQLGAYFVLVFKA